MSSVAPATSTINQLYQLCESYKTSTIFCELPGMKNANIFTKLHADRLLAIFFPFLLVVLIIV